MQMVILDMTLKTHLRPTTNLGSLRLHILKLGALNSAPKSEDKDACGIGVSQNHSIALILIQQSRQWIHVWMIIDKESVNLDRNFQLHRLEKVVGARAGKNRDALSGTANILFEISVYPHEVCIETIPFRSVGLISFGAFRKLFAHKAKKVMAPLLICLSIEIQTHDRQVALRFKSRQFRDEMFQ